MEQQRKDVTPQPEKQPKKLHHPHRFITSLCGGLIGGAVIFGGLYLTIGLSNGSSNSGSTATVGTVDSSGNTKVSSISYDVNSSVTDAVTKVQDAVVSVINMQAAQTTSDNPFAGMFGESGGSSQGGSGSDSDSDSSSTGDLEAASEGSGVIYKVEGDYAYLVTNNHVVDGQDGLEVLLADGTKVTGELVGTDSYTDLAVIKIPSAKVTTVAEFGDSDALKVGEPAIAIGSPLGTDYANSVTQGIISASNREVDSTNDSGDPVYINAIQTDAAINPGNSGGPLVNVAGQVIGINSSKIAESSESSSSVSVEGLGFAIPSNDVVTIINQLEKDGKVSRPALGVSITDLMNLSTQEKEYIGVSSDLTEGVVVASVTDATPAATAGLKQYDVIVKVDDTTIDSTTALTKVLKNKAIGDSVTIEYYRGTDKKSVKVKLTLDSTALTSSDDNSAQTGGQSFGESDN